MNTHIFREYDIRGVVDRDLTLDIVYTLGRSFGTFFRNQGLVGPVCVGRDTRLSSPAFAEQIVRGLRESGCDVVDIGLVPTPLVYYSQFVGLAEAGVMVTGSHNPADNNGFKLCLRKSSVYAGQIQEIRRLAETREWSQGEGSYRQHDLIPAYLDDVRSRIQLERPLKVVVDAGNGVGGLTALPLYRALGCEVIEMFCEPDGRFPNHHPDPTVPENLIHAIAAAHRENADLVVALDGDSDRIGVVDEKGRVLWGDQLMILFSRDLLTRHPGATIIGEVKCSQTLFDDIAAHGGNPLLWKVGHSIIKTKMKETGALLAGEMSGHLFFAENFFGFDDAAYAGARLMEILSRQQRPLSALLDDVPKKVSTPEIRLDCPDDVKFAVVENLKAELTKTHKLVTVDGVRVLFPGGWGLVRASNTQPVLVMRFEANNQEELDEYRQFIEDKVRSLHA